MEGASPVWSLLLETSLGVQAAPFSSFIWDVCMFFDFMFVSLVGTEASNLGLKSTECLGVALIQE